MTGRRTLFVVARDLGGIAVLVMVCWIVGGILASAVGFVLGLLALLYEALRTARRLGGNGAEP